MQAAAREVKGAEGVSRYKLAGIIPARFRFRPAGWRSKRTYRVKTRASAAIFHDPMFAEVCTGKRLNRPDNRRFFQVVKRGAVNDSIGQGGDYASAAGAERKNCFCVKKVFVSLHCRTSLAFSRSSDSKAIRRSGENILAVFRTEIAGRPDLLWRSTQCFGDQPFTFGPVPYQCICQRGGRQPDWRETADNDVPRFFSAAIMSAEYQSGCIMLMLPPHQ